MTYSTRAYLLVTLFALAGWAIGTFWAPPMLWSDTATGLQAWLHFAAGGTWNTLPLPDPIDVARTIEQPVTWWSPGQYVPLGVLTSIGLPLGSAMLLLATVGLVATGVGFVQVAKALEAPEMSLPWVAVAVVGSWHSLYPFGMFIGGEVALIAIWPWIALAGIKWRGQPMRLIVGLPLLFIFGSWAKHSFALYGLALLTFLWTESIRAKPATWKNLWEASWPLLVAGLLFVVARATLLATAGPSPADPGQVHRGILEAWGFSAIGPMLAATGLGSLMGRVFFLAGINPEMGWAQWSGGLTLCSLAPLVGYAALARSTTALDRFAATAALLLSLTMFVLLLRGGSISLDDRHFRGAGILLLIVVATATCRCSGWQRLLARGTIVTVVLFGAASMFARHHRLATLTHRTAAGNSIADASPAVQRAWQDFIDRHRGTNALLYLPTPAAATAVHGGRLLVTDAQDRPLSWFASTPRAGVVESLLLALPFSMETDGRAAALRASFIDYPKEGWHLSHLENWSFAEARTTMASPIP